MSTRSTRSLCKNNVALGILRFTSSVALTAGSTLVFAQTGARPASELQTVTVQADKRPDNEKIDAAKTAPSALRSDAGLFETAQSVSVITGRQIAERQNRSVAEALEGVAGVSSGAYGRRGWDDFIIRGQISSAQTYVDGLRTQSSTNVLRAEDISGISSIEVLKGPTSVGFGMTLPGGLVNLTTKRPQAESFNRAEVTVGSYGLKETTFDINRSSNGTAKGAFRVVGRVSDQDDPTDYVYFKNYYISPSYNFDLDRRNELSIIASYQHRNYVRNQGVPANYASYGRNVFTGEPDRHYSVDVYRIGYNYAHYFDSEWVYKQNFAISQGRSWSNSVFSAANATFPVVARQINYQDKQDVNFAWDNYLQRNFHFSRVNYDLTVGVDLMRERSDYYSRVDNINAFDVRTMKYGVTSIRTGTPSYNLTYNQYAGIYTRNTVKIDEKWIIGLSGRQDFTQVEIRNRINNTITKNSDSPFTGSASVMYRVNDNVAPYVSYSTSFQPVTDSGAGGALLNPETGKQAEVGMKLQALDQRVQGYLALYDLKRTNVTEADATLGYSVQTGEQTTRGFEAELATAITRQWNVSAAYSYIPTAETTASLTAGEVGKRINHVPKNAASLFSQYYFQADKLGWNLGGGIRSQGDRTAQRGTYFVNLPGYALFDLNAGFQQKAWGVNVGIKNLFDRDYLQGTTPNAQLIAFGSPRTIAVNARFNF